VAPRQLTPCWLSGLGPRQCQKGVQNPSRKTLFLRALNPLHTLCQNRMMLLKKSDPEPIFLE
jgi:hypothetical protein